MDYDELRRQNIAKRQAVFAELFKDLKTETKDLKKEQLARAQKTGYFSDDDTEFQPSKKKRRLSTKDSSSYKTKNFHLEFKRTYSTRQTASKSNDDDVVQTIQTNKAPTHYVEEDESDTDDVMKKQCLPNGRSLKIIFPWATTFDREMELMIRESTEIDKDNIA